MAVGAARVAQHHHEVAFLGVVLRQLDDVLRLVRHVVLRELGRFAVRAHVGAVEAVVAGVAWPHPVVGVAAELADAVGRRVHQAHIADLELLQAVELQAAVVAGHGAAVAGILFAGRHQGLLVLLDGVDAGLAGQLGDFRGDDLVADVGDFVGDEDAAAWRCRQFLGHGLGQEAVLQQVALRRRIDGDAVVDAVVVGDHQALRRHEGSRAAAQADDGAHRELGQAGQVGRIQLEAGGFQLLGHLWQLLRHPHAFVRVGGEAAQDGEREKSLFHARVIWLGRETHELRTCLGR